MPEGRRLDTKQIARRVIDLLEADLVASGFDLLDVRVFQGGGRFQIRIFVDLIENRDSALDEAAGNGVSMDQVAKAGRTANMLLEEADLFAGQYVIEVSSPGIRRPLRKPEHYRRALGEKIDLKVAGSSRVRGVLQELDGDELVILSPVSDAPDNKDGEAEATRVKLDRVLEGNLDPDFDAQAIINADRRERKETKRRDRLEKTGRKKKGRPKNRAKDRPENDGGST